MNELVKKLAQARFAEAECRQELAELEAEIKEQYGETLDRLHNSLATAKQQAAEADEAVRQTGLEQFAATGDKQVHAAVKIKEYTTLAYDEFTALNYSREHLPNALILNKRKFEKAAEALDLDFVTVSKEPRATIAKDLSAYLE